MPGEPCVYDEASCQPMQAPDASSTKPLRGTETVENVWSLPHTWTFAWRIDFCLHVSAQRLCVSAAAPSGSGRKGKPAIVASQQRLALYHRISQGES